MVRLVILPAARMDLIEIGDFIALDNPERAASFVAEMESRMIEVAGRPGSFGLLHSPQTPYGLPAAESALMVPGAFAAADTYARLTMPVAIIVGTADRLVDAEVQPGCTRTSRKAASTAPLARAA